MDNEFAAGRTFILRQGRLLERRLLAACFEGGPAAGVVDALRGYRNDDGGFGHGLEPDKRCPASLPIDVEVALRALATAGTVDLPLVLGACEYLAGVAASAKCKGAVPLAFPVIEAYPRAAHWTEWTYEPALNPTAGLVGLLHQLRVDHAWVAEATSWCCRHASPGPAERPPLSLCQARSTSPSQLDETSGYRDPCLQRLRERSPMATDRPARPPRQESGVLSQRVPKPAEPAEPSPDRVNSRAEERGQATTGAEGQAAQVLVEPETAIGNEPDTPRRGASEAVAAILASLDGLWVFSIPIRTIHWRIPGSWWLGSVLSGAWPLILNGLLTITYRRIALHTGSAWVWLTIFAVTQTGALVASRILWGRVVRDMPIIVMMLPGQDGDRRLADWIRSWCSVPLQAVAGFTLSALGGLVLWLASPVVGQHLELGPVSYVSVAWTSFMGGLVLYAFVMATLMTFQIQNCGPLTLDPWDPASTPGLKTLSRGYIYCLSIVIIIAAGLEMVATKVPGYRDSFVLGIFVVGFPIFAVLCGLFVGVLPQLAINHITYVSKMRTVGLIDEAIGDVSTSMSKDHGRLATLVWLRGQVSAAPGLPLRAPWLVPLGAALIGPLVAFLLTVKR